MVSEQSNNKREISSTLKESKLKQILKLKRINYNLKRWKEKNNFSLRDIKMSSPFKRKH